MNTHVLHVWTQGNLQPLILFKSYEQASDYRDVLQKQFDMRYHCVFIILEIA